MFYGGLSSFLGYLAISTISSIFPSLSFLFLFFSLLVLLVGFFSSHCLLASFYFLIFAMNLHDSMLAWVCGSSSTFMVVLMLKFVVGFQPLHLLKFVVTLTTMCMFKFVVNL
jgi:hypothetical protein